MHVNLLLLYCMFLLVIVLLKYHMHYFKFLTWYQNLEFCCRRWYFILGVLKYENVSKLFLNHMERIWWMRQIKHNPLLLLRQHGIIGNVDIKLEDILPKHTIDLENCGRVGTSNFMDLGKISLIRWFKPLQLYEIYILFLYFYCIEYLKLCFK